jgi:hypothetical protein
MDSLPFLFFWSTGFQILLPWVRGNVPNAVSGARDSMNCSSKREAESFSSAAVSTTV